MKFQREAFDYHGGYLTYGADRKFVARFKYAKGGGPKKADYIRLLTKYYTQEDYFERVKTRAPGQILMDDGFVTYDAENRRILVAK